MPLTMSYRPSCLTPYEPTETSHCVNPQYGTSTSVTNNRNNPLLTVEYQLSSCHLATLLANDSTRSLLQRYILLRIKAQLNKKMCLMEIALRILKSSGIVFADDSADMAIALFIDDFSASKIAYCADKITMMIIFAFDPALRHHLEYMVPVAVLPFASNEKRSRLMLSMLLDPLLTTWCNLNMACVS
ncbi:hypothetical protein DM01DRAFT_1408354 [Hesseltinella vesiculosa]|uniref:Uncharacterized protein n=1 Tax=Hesseltinella vesiculosa TaxID=101127 RepID=A0A1X2GE83_9FUNG|nr:hypothetical protein DM01DRAFT_1408354 [Hesseltinella vesiculosa]